MNLTPEQRTIGRENFYNSLGVTRRDVLKASVVAPALGAFYFGYSKLESNPVRTGLIGSGSQGNVLLSESNPDFVQFIAYSDIRPSQIERAKTGDLMSESVVGFLRKYEMTEEQFKRDIQFYEDYHQLLENPDIELVVIALPLHLHYQVTMDALDAGKHVLCEKLMAKEVSQCKEMARKAREKGLYLAVGNQRHYNVLYDNAVSLIDDNLLGDIQHIQAHWHRNNSWPRKQNDEILMEDGQLEFADSWRPSISDADQRIDFEKYGYKSLEELCRWRFYNRTGGGLMAELGSHQLDACSIFLGQVHPLAVSGLGGKYFYEDDREVDDHVYVNFEFPGFDHPQGKNAGTKSNDIVVVTYSSITTNSMERYGEQIMGSRGTMFVEREQEVMLYKELGPDEEALSRPTELTVTGSGSGDPVLTAAESPGAASAGSGWAKETLDGTSRGYREEMEHLAWCIRNPEPENQPRCHAEVGLTDAVYTLTSNLAIRRQQRIEFQSDWFDVESEAVPETDLA